MTKKGAFVLMSYQDWKYDVELNCRLKTGFQTDFHDSGCRGKSKIFYSGVKLDPIQAVLNYYFIKILPI